MNYKTYPVLDKFTYQKKHQSDYSYMEKADSVSENLIEPRLMYRETQDLLNDWQPVTLCDGGIPKLSFHFAELYGCVADLSDASGFSVSYDCEADEGFDCLLRVTFFSDEQASFCSICRLAAGEHTVHFSTTQLTFPAAVTRVKLDVYAQTNIMRLRLTVLSLKKIYALDMLGQLGGQLPFYTCQKAALSQQADGSLRFAFHRGGELISPQFPDNNRTVCNMLMPQRNTVFMVLANDSSLAALTLAYRTTIHDGWCKKTISIQPHSDMTAYYFNLSDTAACEGRMLQFKLITEGVAGTITIQRYSFEEEKRIVPQAGKVLSCRAYDGKISIAGTLQPQYAGGVLCLYQTDMSDDDDSPDGKEKVLEASASEHFLLENIPLMHKGISRISAQLLLFVKLENGEMLKVDDRFYLQNAADFTQNPYAFSLPDYRVDCCDFGAKGDAIKDDTDAIQAAIDDVNAHGGGVVEVRGDDSFYGRRYLVTNLLLRSRVELHIGEGAVLWQSQVAKDYCYRPAYGHDGVIDGINWTHSMHICNLPILHAHNCEYIKITGKGKIRSMDTGSEEGVGMPAYSSGCPDRIHQISIGLFNVHHFNFSDFEIVRANNYHISTYACTNYSIIGIKMHEVKCVSGDGIGVGFGSCNVYLANNFFQSNDDAVTLWSCYHDPRGLLWWSSVHDGCCGPHDVLIEHCYMNSGGGKCIAFIPWGTTQRCGELSQISNIVVRDCCLSGVNPVGAWPDNPYYGKMPFDNLETDDYSPVKDVYIHNNRYLGNCTLYPLVATNLWTDCGIRSASHFLNGDFTLGGFANWDVRGQVSLLRDQGKESAQLHDGEIFEGLYLAAGHHVLKASLKVHTAAVLFARDGKSEALIAEKAQQAGEGVFTLEIEMSAGALVQLGVHGMDAQVLRCEVCSSVDEDENRRKAVEAFRAQIQEMFVLPQEAEVDSGNPEGKLALTADATLGHRFLLESRAAYTDFEISAFFRILEWHKQREKNGYGFLLCSDDTGCSYQLQFLESEKLLKICYLDGKGGCETIYQRENFFFTSIDFHHFRIRVSGKSIVFWIDNAKYATVCDERITSGKAAIYTEDCAFVLYQAMIEG